MQARVQMCAGKGFDAVEPDLLDGFENSTGFPITPAQQIAYNTMIAGLAHAAGRPWPRRAMWIRPPSCSRRSTGH
jgi:hypothetical protein